MVLLIPYVHQYAALNYASILLKAICSIQVTMCDGWISKKAYLVSFINCFSPAGGEVG